MLGVEGTTNQDNQDSLPPLGIKPKQQWLEERMQEINAAIVRYAEAKLIIPIEWLNEYLQLSREIESIKSEAIKATCDEIKNKIRYGLQPSFAK